MTDDSVTTHNGIAYANHDGVELPATFICRRAAKDAPALVAVHGGGWVQGVRTAFQYWGPYLAARGIAMFSISYRLATKGKTFPQAVQDVLAGVQFVRGKAGEFGIDPAAHRAPRRLRRRPSRGAGGARRSSEILRRLSAGPLCVRRRRVKALVGVYGIYDAVAMWTNYQLQGGRDNNFQKFIGAPPMENRQLYFDASPISYATFANNKIGVLLVTGTAGRPGRSQGAHRPVPAGAQAGRLLRAALHRARRAALLDERSDRGAGQLFGLPGAAADALPRRETLKSTEGARHSAAAERAAPGTLRALTRFRECRSRQYPCAS